MTEKEMRNALYMAAGFSLFMLALLILFAPHAGGGLGVFQWFK